jgi:signal transduction histidine kinase
MSLEKIIKLKNTLLFRLTVLYAGIFTLSSVLIFFAIYFKIHSVAIKDMDEEFLDEISQYAEHMSRSGLEVIVTKIEEMAESEDPNEEFYRIITFEGEVLFSTNMSEWGSPNFYDIPEAIRRGETDHVFNTLKIQGRDHKARLVSAVIGPGTVLQIGEALEEIEDYLDIFLSWFLILLIIVMVLSAFLGWFMARRALQDMEEVTKTATEISNGAYDKRVQLRDQYEEIQRLGGTFNVMLDRIQNLLQSMREVNDNIAHDLRSPLARIRGIAEINVMNKKTIDDYRNMAASIVEECDSLIDIINTMMDITEIESGINRPEIEAIDITRLIHDAVEIFKPMADEKRLRLNVQMKDKLIFHGDRKKLQRMVSNLLDNAIKYTPEGGSVSVTALSENEMLRIVFEDSGIGISDTDIPRIFERFYRCDKSRSQGGIGLGLSLAKAFAEAMHGTIRVKSILNRGSAFTVTFPEHHSPGALSQVSFKQGV